MRVPHLELLRWIRRSQRPCVHRPRGLVSKPHGDSQRGRGLIFFAGGASLGIATHACTGRHRWLLCQAPGESVTPSATRVLRSCTVYLGSSHGVRPKYREEVAAFGRLLAERGYKVVYGGCRNGLMGVLADAALSAGGEVYGVVPTDLVEKEVAHKGLTSLDIVDDMTERKHRMLRAGDFIVAMPGGFGTWEEFLEALAWSQLGYHEKPLGILNVDGYYEPLLHMFKTCAREGFMKEEFISYVVVGESAEELLDKLENYSPKRIRKV